MSESVVDSIEKNNRDRTQSRIPGPGGLSIPCSFRPTVDVQSNVALDFIEVSLAIREGPPP